MKKICVFGNFSGRNAGDNAILGCLMQDISSRYPGVHFIVPTINPGFVQRSFPKYSVDPVSLMPWNFSLKIFGLPAFQAALKADLILVTDNILFDRKLLNPLYNYLSTLSLVLPKARAQSIPVALYNMSLGPIATELGKKCFQRVIQSTDLIILRDQQSSDLVENLGIEHAQIEIKADCAVNTRSCSAERLKEIVLQEGLFRNPNGTIGININSYLDVYLKSKNGYNRDSFTDLIAQFADRLIDELGSDILFVVTQVMDTGITKQAVDKVKQSDRVKMITNHVYTYEELASVMGRLEMLIGMRTHALILASAMITPVVGIISYPKSEGYLASIEQDDWMIKFADLNVDNLVSISTRAHGHRKEIREILAPAMRREQMKASSSAELLAPYLT